MALIFIALGFGLGVCAASIVACVASDLGELRLPNGEK